MPISDEDREFRLRPGKPRVARTKGAGNSWTPGFRMLMHYARQSRGARPQGSSSGMRSLPHRQRCAVRITYLKNRTKGQWRAHGRYLERESAAGGEAGFNARETDVNISARLQIWQASKDELLWKFIISPEFGERADLQRLTRDVMLRVEEDVGTSLDWVATVHRNTEHPHVHVAMRGVAADGKTLRFSRDYVKCGVREIAEELCTRQMGFRTTLDATEAARWEINETRLTSLDRVILKRARVSEYGLVFVQESEKARPQTHHVSARLIALARMGLAESTGQGSWLLRSDMAQVLRAMQRAGDRQKTLAVHGELLSDKRLRAEVADWRQFTSVEGRILVHGEDEHSGKGFLMLEATSARVLYIPYTEEMEECRSLGGLKTNSFIRLRRVSTKDGLRIEIEDLGHSEAMLTNRPHLREKVDELRRQGLHPADDGWEGWLGRYQKALCEVNADHDLVTSKQEISKEVRRKPRSLER